MLGRTPPVRAGALSRLSSCRAQTLHARAFTGKPAAAGAPSATSSATSSPQQSEEPAATTISRRKLNLAHLVANRKDRDFALSAFFATHRPLVNGEEAKAARLISKQATEVHAENGRIEIARYNDEYAKIFGTFTPYLPPSHHKLYNAMDPAVLPSTHMRSPSTPFLATASSSNPASQQRNTGSPTIADYLVYKSISKPLPSSLLPPAAPGLSPAQQAAAKATAAANSKPLPPSQDDLDILGAYYANANASCGMTLQQMVDNSGPAYQPGQRATASPSLAAAPAAVTTTTTTTATDPLSAMWRGIMPSQANPATRIVIDPEVFEFLVASYRHAGRVRRKKIHAISIMKRRRMKMKKHKWKKARRAVRDSTRYNRERKRKGGLQREKQE
ncbi:hypothetical protein HDU86_006015 [Geranomyces michiganensis]|nr:hypothetical protein HDU86_006015 [Geranomyces michiganensis]